MMFEYIVPGVISGGMKRYSKCFSIVEKLLNEGGYAVDDASIENNTNIVHGTLVKHYNVTKDGKGAYVDIRQGYSNDPDHLPHYTIIINGNDEQFVKNVGEKLTEIHHNSYNDTHVSNGGRRLKIHRKRKTRRLKKTRHARKTRRT